LLVLRTEKLEPSRSADYYNEDLYKNLEELTLEASGNSTQSGGISNEPSRMALLEFPANGSSQDASVGTCALSSVESSSSHGSNGSHRSNGSDGSGCSSRPSSRRTHEEDIYEDLCYVSLRNVSNSVGTCSQSALALEKRDYCLKELLETERNYVDALHMIQSYFMRPLKSCMRPDDRSVVFGQVGQLADLHRTFLDELTEACKANGNAVQQRISACFVRWKDRFVLYGDYCANLPTAQALLDQLCSKNEFLHTKILQYQVRDKSRLWTLCRQAN
jgi:hypothetical protein